MSSCSWSGPVRSFFLSSPSVPVLSFSKTLPPANRWVATSALTFPAVDCKIATSALTFFPVDWLATSAVIDCWSSIGGALQPFNVWSCLKNNPNPRSTLLSLFNWSPWKSAGLCFGSRVPFPIGRIKSESLLDNALLIGFVESVAHILLKFSTLHVLLSLPSFLNTKLLSAEYVFDTMYSLNSWLEISPSLSMSSRETIT